MGPRDQLSSYDPAPESIHGSDSLPNPPQRGPEAVGRHIDSMMASQSPLGTHANPKIKLSPLVQVLIALGVVALITHPWGQVVTRRGAGATVDDTEDAAQEAREHVGTGAGDARRPGRPERGGSRGREAREGRRPEAGTPQWYPVGEDDVGPRDRGAAQGGTRRAGHPPARRGEDGLAP